MFRLLFILFAVALIGFACSETPTDNPPVTAETFTGIFFARSATVGQMICRVDPDGGNVDTLTDSISHKETPAVSPDGKKLVFAAGQLSDMDLFVLEIDSVNPYPITQTSDPIRHPVWSADGTRLLFEAGGYDGANRWIMMVNADGTGIEAITDGTTDYHSPVWSPTSADSIFYIGPSGQLHMVNLADGGSIVIPLGLYDPYGVRFSPIDSSFLMYADIDIQNDSAQWHLYRGDLSGVRPSDISDPDMYDYTPSWSPDGTRFVFRSDGFYQHFYDDRLMIANANGSGRAEIPGTNTNDKDPFWSPATMP